MRVSAALGASAAALFLVSMLVAWLVSRDLFSDLLAFSLLTVAAGREAAMLVAYQGATPVPVAWIVVVTLLQDLAALFLVVPLVWLGAERLREAYFVGGLVVSLEKAALTHHRFLARWGVAGLALLVVFPGVGTGVATAAAIGALARIQTRRLLLVLGATLVVVVLFWSVLLRVTAGAIDDYGSLHHVPVLLVGVMVAVGVAAAIRQRRRRSVLPLRKVTLLSSAQKEALEAYGIRDGTELMYVDCRILGARLGIPHGRLGRCRSVSELCLATSASPREGEMLASVGVLTVRDLAVAPPWMTEAALRELELGHAPDPAFLQSVAEKAVRWHSEATQYLGESGTLPFTRTAGESVTPAFPRRVVAP